jgi:hypothetical protein
VIADIVVHPYEVGDIARTFQSVPAAAIGISILGALIGWAAAGAFDPLPAGWGISLGVVCAVALTGFNDPELGVTQPTSTQCVHLAVGSCMPPVTLAAPPAGFPR